MGNAHEGPVGAFCAELRQRWRASGRSLSSVAREMRISRAQLYAILNGEIKRPPDYDTVVRPLIRLCGGTEAEQADWRRRHEVLVGVHTELGRRTADRVPAPKRAPVPAQLPAGVEGFTGRAAELATLRATAAPIVAITGAAGVGKTALAVHWARQVAAGFPDGQLYVDLRGFDRGLDVVEPAEAIRGFLDALGVPPDRVPRGHHAQAALYRSLSAGARLLVVLDNARDADHVRPLLAGGPAVRTIATSRNRLTGLVVEVGAEPLALDSPDHAEALELLHRRAGTDRWDAEAADTIVTACGRLPLALAVVAARVRQTGFSLPALAAELRRPDLDVLAGVRVVFSWSYRALGPRAARLLPLLALAGGADISAAAAAALSGAAPADVGPALHELTEASLLIEQVPGRYQLHDLVRRYAAELASEVETDHDRRAALTRLLDHYTHTAYEAELLLNPTRAPIPLPVPEPAEGTLPKERLDVKAALQWLGTERAVLLSALRQAKDEGMNRHAWQLGWALDTFLSDHNRWQDEGAAWAVALKAAMALVDRPAAAHAHRFLAVVAGRLDRFGEAYAHLHQAAELCRAADDRPGEAETHYILSYVCWLQTDFDRALEHAHRSLALWSALGNAGWEGKANNAVGWYLAQVGDHQQALSYHERALKLQQDAGNGANEALAWDTVGRAHHNLARYATAADMYEQGLRRARAVADPIIEAQLETHLGDTHQAIDDLASAREHWQEAYSILAGIGHVQAADVGRRLDALPSRHDSEG